jgi:hypothetical protein
VNMPRYAYDYPCHGGNSEHLHEAEVASPESVPDLPTGHQHMSE